MIKKNRRILGKDLLQFGILIILIYGKNYERLFLIVAKQKITSLHKTFKHI